MYPPRLRLSKGRVQEISIKHGEDKVFIVLARGFQMGGLSGKIGGAPEVEHNKDGHSRVIITTFETGRFSRWLDNCLKQRHGRCFPGQAVQKHL